MLSSLPNELVIEILARVPRRCLLILSCVSKNLRNFVRSSEFRKTRSSPEFRKTRSLLGLDFYSLYICFLKESTGPRKPIWFTLRRNEKNPAQNIFTSIDSPSPSLAYSDLNPRVIAIGHEMFFFYRIDETSSTFFIFDSRSKEFREDPSMRVEHLYKSFGLVDNKIYVLGGAIHDDDVVQAKSFDLDKRIWEIAPVPEIKGFCRWICPANVSLDNKVLAFPFSFGMNCYDTSNGSCEKFEMADIGWWKTGLCVIENVLYVHYAESGLMWFDTEVKLWRVVDGFSHLERVRSVGMGEYYGKLAFLWTEDLTWKAMEIWCRMIALDKSQEGIRGTAEPSQLLGIVPRSYRWEHCVSVSD